MIQSIPIRSKLGGFYFFYYAIVGIFMPYWNLYLQHQGFSFQQIGWLSSIAIITRFFAPLIWGWIADKTGKRMLLVRIATWVESCIWFLIFIIPNNFQSIAALMLIFSFFQNAILAQFEGVTLFWLGDEKAKYYGRVRKWGSVGFIAAVFLIGELLDIISIRWLPIILLSIAFLAFLWAFTIQEPSNAPKAQKNLQPIWQNIRRPTVLAFFSIEFILLFSFAPFYSFYSNYLHAQHYTTAQIGTLWATGVIAEIIMFAYAQRVFLQRFSWQKLVILCILLTSIRWLIVGVYSHYFVIQIMAQTLHAFSFGLFHLIAMRVIFQNFSAEQQGRGQALYSTMWGIGVAVGSILAGHYWNMVSGQHIFIYAAIAVLVALPLTYWLPRQSEADGALATKS